MKGEWILAKGTEGEDIAVRIKDVKAVMYIAGDRAYGPPGHPPTTPARPAKILYRIDQVWIETKTVDDSPTVDFNALIKEVFMGGSNG